AGDPERIVDANTEFHARVRSISGNVVLDELIGLVDRRVRWYYRRVVRSRGEGSWNEHADLIDAIEAHDEERAAAIARRHTERTRQVYHERVTANEDPFGN
ncbi:MAG: FCD domain-containing protein, partial [Actinomadura sp.]